MLQAWLRVVGSKASLGVGARKKFIATCDFYRSSVVGKSWFALKEHKCPPSPPSPFPPPPFFFKQVKP